MMSDGRTDYNLDFRIFKILPWEDGAPEKKGWRGVVLKADSEKGEICLKILRGKVPGTSLKKEAEILKEANKIGIGPKFLGYDSEDEVLAMEFVDGHLFMNWIENATDAEIKRIVSEVLEQGLKLDKAGIEHGQLSSAPKHIIIGKRPVIIDFERGGLDRKVHNFNSLTSFLLLNPNSAHAKRIRGVFGVEIQELKDEISKRGDLIGFLKSKG